MAGAYGYAPFTGSVTRRGAPAGGMSTTRRVAERARRSARRAERGTATVTGRGAVLAGTSKRSLTGVRRLAIWSVVLAP